MRATFKHPSCPLVVSLSRGFGVIFELTQVHFLLLDRIQARHSHTNAQKNIVCSSSKRMRIVLDQNSLAHFLSQPWCKICVASRGRDSPHQEQPKNGQRAAPTSVSWPHVQRKPSTEFLVPRTPLLEPSCRHWCQTPRRWTCPVVAGTARWVRDLGYERFCQHEDKERVLHLLLDKVAKDSRPVGHGGQIIRQMSPTQSHKAMAQRRRPSPHCAVLLAHTWQSSKTATRVCRRGARFADVAVDHHTLRVFSRDTTCAEAHAWHHMWRFVDRNMGERSCHWENKFSLAANQPQAFGWTVTPSTIRNGGHISMNHEKSCSLPL